MSATVRFAKLVEAAGKPQLHTLWAGAEHDPEFQRAVKAHRVLTVRQENVGTKADFGQVGFVAEGPAQYLIFPRSLKAFEGRKVVGIKYDLIQEPPPARAAARSKAPSPKKTKSVKTEKPAPPRIQPEPTKREAAPAPQSAPLAAAERERPARQAEQGPRATPVAAKSKPAEPEVSRYSFDRSSTLAEIKQTMDELEAGKAVIAYRRLEKLAAKLGDTA